MVALVDIKKSINQVLKDNFKNIKLYSEEVKEGFKRPSFFTSLIPVLSNYDTTNFTSNKVMVVINYFSKNETVLENIKMIDELKKALGMNLIVSKKHIPLDDIRINEVDGVLQFKFDLNYFDKVKKDLSEYEIMKELNLNKEG